MIFCVQPKCSGGTRRSRTEWRALRTNNAHGVLQLQELINNAVILKAALDRDWRANVRLIAEEVELPKTDVHPAITEDLHMRRNCEDLVPKNLSDDQNDNRVLLSRDLLERVKWTPLSAARGNWRRNLRFQIRSHNQKHSTQWHTSQLPQKRRQIKWNLRFFIQSELLTSGLCHSDRLWIKHFTYRYQGFGETELCVSAVKLQTLGSFAMTMCQVTH
jgi:hypothetical protein